MNYVDAIILGLVQGLTEFLPVSSSGHLVMAQTFLGTPAPGIVLEVTLHVATLLSVVMVYRSKLAELVVGTLRRDAEAVRYVAMLIVATLPVTVVALIFEEAVESAFDAPYVTGFMLLVTGFLLYSTMWGVKQRADDRLGLGQALAMGFAQCLALFPGISRSGSTIAAGLWVGLRGERAAEFSFLMSLPVIAGAAILKSDELAGANIGGPLALSFIVALLAGIAAIKSLVWLVKRQGFHHFAWYVWPLGLFFLGYLYLA